MIKVISTGIMVENNFGCPSILHGLEELLTLLYGDDYELTHYQFTQYNAISASDFSCNMVALSVPPREILWAGIKDRFGIKVKDPKLRSMLDEIKTADVIADLFGICFCDNFDKRNYSLTKMIKTLLRNFLLIFLGKINKKKTVKNTSSFGPMDNKINYKSANFACKHIFDIVSAREEKSRHMLINKAKVNKNILFSPDIANIMKYSPQQHKKEKPIGISTSHQIIRQWGSEEHYIDCIVNLCKHVISTYSYPIVLIPNEYDDNIKYDDIDVSNNIKDILQRDGYCVDIFNCENSTSTELKNQIASCEVVIASRYHSCVAALSSGVPLLVVGWHYKYEELLHWYGQDKWILSQNDCSSKNLISAFDCLWKNRMQEKMIISKKYSAVQQAVIEAGREMYSKKCYE